MAANGACISLPESVHKALSDITRARGWKNPQFHVEAGSNDGDGYLSALYRIVIRNENDSISLICKTTIASMEKSTFVENVFRAESFIYNRVLPAMEEVAHLRSPLPWPKGYPTDLQSCVIMQDMQPDGFATAERGAVMDEKRCTLLVTQLARFHGAGMALERLRPDLMAEFKAVVGDPCENAELRKLYGPFLKTIADVPEFISDRFPADSPVYEKVKRMCSSFAVDFFEYLRPDVQGGNTIAHGDCHVNNILFQQNEAGESVGCCLIDFQIVRYAWPIPDLTMILLCTTEKATRDKHWDALMRTYHNELQSTLRAAGIQDPDSIYSWSRFQEQLQRAALMAVCMVPSFVYFFGKDCDVKEVQDTVAQVTNDDAKDSADIVRIKIKDTPVVRRRFADAVQSLVEWGYL